MVDLMTIAIAVVITLLVAVLAGLLPRIMTGLMNFVLFVWLAAMWLGLLGVTEIQDMLARIEFLPWVVAAVGGIALGNLVAGILGFGK